jgi:hypothetical protein
MLKYTTKTLPSALMASVLSPRNRAYYFAESCDPLSNCAKKAIEIFLLLDKKKNIPEQNERIKEEVWVILDHEKLLTQHGCCALSQLTLQELLKYMVTCNAKEELIVFVEQMDSEMKRRYSQEITASPHIGSDINLQALVFKHMGKGMDFLEQKFLADKKKQRGWLATNVGQLSSNTSSSLYSR